MTPANELQLKYSTLLEAVNMTKTLLPNYPDIAIIKSLKYAYGTPDNEIVYYVEGEYTMIRSWESLLFCATGKLINRSTRELNKLLTQKIH